MGALGLSTYILLSLLQLFTLDTTAAVQQGRQTYFHTLTRPVQLSQLQNDIKEQPVLQESLENVVDQLQILHTKSPSKGFSAGVKGDLPLLGHVKDSLLGVSEGGSTCFNDTGLIITSLLGKNNSWALHFLDAMGKPAPGILLYRFNFVGSYKECRSSEAPTFASGRKGFKGNYCTLGLSLPGGGSLMGMGAIQLGACMPDTCTEADGDLLMQKLSQRLTNGTLSPAPTQCHTDDREMTNATIVSIVVVSVIVFLMVVGTVVDILLIQRPKWQSDVYNSGLVTNLRNPETNGYGAVDVNPVNETTNLLGLHSEPQEGICTKILVAFSVYTNGQKVLNTAQPAGSLSSIHGIRFISMTWVIFCHTYIFGLGTIANALESFPELLKRWTFDPIANGFVSVDTFFTLSGLLTAYLTIKEMKKSGWKINWALFYFHRFWRLTPPYMLTLLVVLGFQQYLGSGALWPTVQPADRDNCNDYWWTNLLYVNNLVDADKMCFGHSWYLSNDMQFYIISPLMLIPFYFNALAGLASCIVFLLVCFITTAVLSVQNDWPVTLVSLASPNVARILDWFNHYYMVPWCRVGAFVVGILAGYLLANNKGKVHLPRYAVAAGWIVSIAVALAVVYGVHGDITGENPSSIGTAAFYNAVARSAWAACVCWVIVACSSGYGGFINTFLSWSPFVTLGRLTYMAYLIHPCLIYVYYQNQEQLYYLTDISIVVTMCGILVCTYLISFVLMLGFESPMIGLEKTLLHKKRKE
ncbi:nose resistant to fluoxetine protein 6-like [Physella acuta]|uniref:nose resistant to fluoxetine protein 6-like n=1 Tax=Physella acuta TaxID=109671 RepID=UPI0027DC10F5|nr:nose resistant to fluoxetine protein 6-like [Physella acuta]XP_059140277.1 nose resistant to fluoxetine protein 6-like [Physella acuta]